MSGIERIEAERSRQIDAEGFDAQSDDCYERPDLAEAGATYALYAGASSDATFAPLFSMLWPWSGEAFKPSSDPIRNLEKAGALIAAEIDRIERLATPAALRTKRSRP